MKLYYSPTSPYVRKVMVVAHEVGLADRIERVACAANPISRDAKIVAHNPLGQVPTLIADDSTAFADSGVICEYLDAVGNGTLFPKTAPVRWQALNDHSAADGMLGACLLIRYETFMRPEALRWDGWTKGQWEKVHSVIDLFEAHAGGLKGRVDIGTVTLGCALSYLDLRFTDAGWRTRAPALAKWYATFAERPSMVATKLVG
jgi:glutathione S-transferase